jgi:hypothetical protein
MTDKAGLTQVIMDNSTPRNVYITDSKVMHTPTVNTQETHSRDNIEVMQSQRKRTVHLVIHKLQ